MDSTSVKEKERVAVLGASGYTGAELVRLLSRHPSSELCVLTASSHAGREIKAVFPHLSGLLLPKLIHIDAVKWSKLDVVFCALPHGTTQKLVAELPSHLKVIDLSADLRLSNVEVYEKWYGKLHQAPDLQKEVVYGLPELVRQSIRAARVVACPGCYPTSVQLPLVPLIAGGLIKTEGIIIDSKSGVSGAGRSLREELLFCEATDSVSAYSIAQHRHIPEIEQTLTQAACQPVVVTFTPHIVAMSRGILSTIYVQLSRKVTATDLREALLANYAEEPFVRIMPEGLVPQTRYVRGSNFCFIGVFSDRASGKAIICSVIDNLVKGASGQAVQNFNLMTGKPETLGLEQQPLFP